MFAVRVSLKSRHVQTQSPTYISARAAAAAAAHLVVEDRQDRRQRAPVVGVSDAPAVVALASQVQQSLQQKHSTTPKGTQVVRAKSTPMQLQM